MSVCYRKLNFPKNPVKDVSSILDQIKNTDNQYHMFNVDPYQALTDEVLAAFDDLDLYPSSATVFHLSIPTTPNDCLMHTDILRVDNRWKSITCGVNWEINNINAKLSWWQTTKPGYFPNDPEYYWFNPHGVHFGGRFNRGIDPAKDREIDSVDTLDSPLLVRTNIPHTVYIPNQDTREKVRCSISVRFNNDFKTWDEAVKYFSKVTR